MTKRLFILLLVFGSIATARAAEPTDVSLVQLIADPMKYHGKLIRVAGYLHLEFEGNGLYLHKEDFAQSLYKNGIWIDPTGKEFASAKANNNSYVLVIGTFDGRSHGHLGLWSGSVGQIERLDPCNAKRRQ